MSARRSTAQLVLTGLVWAGALSLGLTGLPHSHDEAAGSHPVESCKVSQSQRGFGATPAAPPISLAAALPWVGPVILPPAAVFSSSVRSPFSTRAPPRSS
jgi:hypothetical protein